MDASKWIEDIHCREQILLETKQKYWGETANARHENAPV